MTVKLADSTTHVTERSARSDGSAFQRVAFRFLIVFFLLVIAAWEIIRGLDPDTLRLRESFRTTITNLKLSEAKMKSERDDLAKANGVLNNRIKAFEAYAEYEATAQSLRANRRMPVGRLGFPLGTYLKIEGHRVPQSQLARQIKGSQNRLLVDRVNGKAIEKTISVDFDNDNFDVLRIESGRFILNGYETGRPIGMPDHIPEDEGKERPTAIWHFHEYFWVTRVVEPEGASINSRNQQLNP